MSSSSLKDGFGIQLTSHQNTLSINDYITQLLEPTGAYIYDLLSNHFEFLYSVPSLPATLFTALGKWTIGNLYYNQHENQYRLTFTILLPAANWNGTTNPSFVPGNNLMVSKLISEMALLIADANGIPIDLPEIYCKFSQAIAKNNGSDLCIECSLDF